MPLLSITPQAHAAVRAATLAGRDFRDNSRPDPANPGMLLVPVGDDTAERLQKLRLLGETVSDTLIRLLALHGRRPN